MSVSEPVAAGPPTHAYRIKKFVTRNRALAVSASVVICSLFVGNAFAVAGYVRASHAEKLANERATEARLEEEKAKLLSDTLTDVLELTQSSAELGVDFSMEEFLDEALLCLPSASDMSTAVSLSA